MSSQADNDYRDEDVNDNTNAADANQANSPANAYGRAIKNPSLPDPDAKPEDAWQNYMVQAIHSLYPNMRDGVDFSWGKPADDPEGEARMLYWDENRKPPDEGKLREAAQKIADADPYAFYEAQPGLHEGSVKEQTDDNPDDANPNDDYPPEEQPQP